MKILMLTSRFGFGYGMGYSAHKEATAFAMLGHSVTVVHCYSDPEIAHFYDPRVTLVHLPMRRIPIVGFFQYFFKLKYFFREKIKIEDFDSVYIQSLEFGLLDLSRISIPVYYYARSTMRGLGQALQNEGEELSYFARLIRFILVVLEQRCMRYSKMIFVKSERMIGEIFCLYGVNRNKMAVITGGIDNDDFQAQLASTGDTIKHKFKIPSDVPIVLYAGRIVPQKGLRYLIQASLELLQEMNFIVVIAGDEADQSYYAKIKKQVDDSAYKKSFYFLGHVEQREMSRVISLSDCLVTPSLYEPFGMINLQAASLGKAVITTNVVGSVEILYDYSGLRVVSARSSEDISMSLKEIFMVSKNMRPFDFSQYSWMDVATKILKYFSLL